MKESSFFTGVAAFALLAGTALLTAAALPPQGPAQDPSRPVAPESGETHLANIRQLTFGGQNAEAYFSASGRLITFQSTREGNGCDQQYVMNVDGSAVRRISNGQGRTTCGYFYDHDRRVFYASTFGAGPACPPQPDYSQGYVWRLDDYDIYTARPDGSDLRRLTHTPGYDAEGTLSPDGKTIAFTSMRDGDLEIYTMRTDGSHVRRLTHELGYDGGPFWSHDGKHIVYRAGHPAEGSPEAADYRRLLGQGLVRPSQMDLWVMDADGGHKRQVTNVGGASFAPYFTPDDRRIIFATNFRDPRSRNFDLYLVNVDGAGLERVTTYPDFDSFPMFSPDGRKLVWASNRNGHVPHETNIFIADWVP
jgi:Tol biopolymer transport system component